MSAAGLRRTWIVATLSLTSLGAGERGATLIDAAKRGDTATVRALVQRHVDVNAVEADGTTLLHWVVRAGDLSTARLVVRAGANVNLANRYGITPLSLAASNGDASLTRMLLKAGADPNATGPAGETILMTAARTGKIDVLNELLAHGADVHATERSQEQTALMWAAHENHADAVRALIDYGAVADARSKVLTPPEWKWATTGMVSTTLPRGGWTALMHAARQNAMDAAAALADAGADLNQVDPDGSTALVLAIINAHFDLAHLLLEKGADPNVADETGAAALYAAVDMHTLRPMIARPSPRLTSHIDAAALAKALLVHGANPNARLARVGLGRLHESADPALGEGSTPLMRAAKSNDIGVVRLLLDNGADPTLTQKDYTNALMLEAAGGAHASEYPAELPVTEVGALEGIKLLLDRGVDVDSFNLNGQTALHLAAGRGADRIVKLLAERGAKLDARNKQGYTPLDSALGSGRHRPGQDAPVVHETTATLLRQLMGGLSTQASSPRQSPVAPTSLAGARTARAVPSGNPAAANGVYTIAQAERGKAAYLRNCSRCHRTDLSGDEGLALNGELFQTLGPSLRGNTFFANWGQGSVNRLFRKIRDGMPPDFQSIVDDNTKIDIVAYLLHENGFGDGAQELTRDAERLEGIPIVRAGDEHRAAPNFAVVRLVGCLTPGPGSRWMLTNASEPIVTRDDLPADADPKEAEAQKLGVERFVLVNAGPFGPNSHNGQKMEARGLLFRAPDENRITLSSLHLVASGCAE